MWNLYELIIVEYLLNALIHHFSVFAPDGEATLPGMGPTSYPSLQDIDINIAGVTDLRDLSLLSNWTWLYSCKSAERNGWRTLSKSRSDIHCLPAIKKDSTALEEGLGNPLFKNCD